MPSTSILNYHAKSPIFEAYFASFDPILRPILPFMTLLFEANFAILTLFCLFLNPFKAYFAFFSPYLSLLQPLWSDHLLNVWRRTWVDVGRRRLRLRRRTRWRWRRRRRRPNQTGLLSWVRHFSGGIQVTEKQKEFYIFQAI